MLHDAKTHELGCGVGGVGEERREKKVAIPEIRQAWLERPRRPLAIDRSWPCPGHGNAGDLFDSSAPSLMVFKPISYHRLQRGGERPLDGRLTSMGKSKKSKLRVSLPNNLLKEIVIVCHGGPLGLKVSQDSTTGHVLIKSFHLLPSGPCALAPPALSPSTGGSAAPSPWPRYTYLVYTHHPPSDRLSRHARHLLCPDSSSHSSSSSSFSLPRRTGPGGEEPVVPRGRCAALH